MIPIENSVAGRVADIHHLMPDSGLHIVGEHFLPVRHQLLASRARRSTDIKTVESHVHALGQCRKIIRKLGIKPMVAADTAGSAREVAEAGDKTRAAIASRLAAEIYGLDILAEDVEDEAHNTTRFIVLSREAKWAPSGSGPVITTFVFRVRNVPAALYKALGGFATNGVNMTKLESYMIEGNFFATQFYADVEGHPDDRDLVLALEELAFFSKEMKILGVYPAHPFAHHVRGNGGIVAASALASRSATAAQRCRRSARRLSRDRFRRAVVAQIELTAMARRRSTITLSACSQL